MRGKIIDAIVGKVSYNNCAHIYYNYDIEY